MTTITIKVPDQNAARLADIATRQAQTIEEFIANVAIAISSPEYGHADHETVSKAVDYVMTKNHELYKRLA